MSKTIIGFRVFLFYPQELDFTLPFRDAFFYSLRKRVLSVK
jgi:hypothetical protein